MIPAKLQPADEHAGEGGDYKARGERSIALSVDQPVVALDLESITGKS